MLSRDHKGQAGETTPPLADSAASNDDHEAGPLANEAVTVAATVGVVAVGVALFEVALLPGMAIGVAVGGDENDPEAKAPSAECRERGQHR